MCLFSLLLGATVSLPQSNLPSVADDYTCDIRFTYSEDWFLKHLLSPKLLYGTALFYTRGGSYIVQNIVRNCQDFYVTIWNVCKSWNTFKTFCS